MMQTTETDLNCVTLFQEPMTHWNHELYLRSSQILASKASGELLEQQVIQQTHATCSNTHNREMTGNVEKQQQVAGNTLSIYSK